MLTTGLPDLRKAALAAIPFALTLAVAGCATITINEPVFSQQPEAAQSWDAGRAATAVSERAARHRTFLSEGVPVEYVSRTNPWPATQAEIQAGGRLYGAHCASCHGPAGTGYGQAGRDLTLPPAVIAAMIDQPHAVDQYMLWSISEGGLRSGSQMPAFKARFSSREIWQIVNYMRAGFPVVEGEAG